VASSVQAQDVCSQADIKMSQSHPSGGAAVDEGMSAGAIASFQIDTNECSFDTSVPFCVYIHDTTKCKSKEECGSILSGNSWKVTPFGSDSSGIKTACNKLPRGTSSATMLLTPANNDYKDFWKNSIYITMSRPNRYLRIPVTDND